MWKVKLFFKISFHKKDDPLSWKAKGNFDVKLYLLSAWNYEISESCFALTVRREMVRYWRQNDSSSFSRCTAKPCEKVTETNLFIWPKTYYPKY